MNNIFCYIMRKFSANYELLGTWEDVLFLFASWILPADNSKLNLNIVDDFLLLKNDLW